MRRFRSLKSSPVVLHAVGEVVPWQVFDVDDDEGDRLDSDFVEVGSTVPLGLPATDEDDETALDEELPPVVDEEPRPPRGPRNRHQPSADAGSTEETA